MTQSKKTRRIHDLAAAALILRILDEEEPKRRHNFIVATDSTRVDLKDARQFMVEIVNEIVEIV